MPQTTTGDSGVLGRIFKAIDAQAVASGEDPIKTSAYSINSDRTMFRGSPVDPVLLSSYQGMLTYEGSQTAATAYNPSERSANLKDYQRLVSNEAGSLFAETHNAAVRASLHDSERVSALLRNATLTQDWRKAINRASKGHGQDFVAQFEQVASVIAAREPFEAERDVFYVEFGGFDHHAEVLDKLQEKFRDINFALEAFVAEMKAQGVWDHITVQSLSEFGRTLTSNGRGTDHAWGGNHFTIGGGVRGGEIHGEYPELRIDGAQSVSSRGALLPTMPWESIWKPLSLWLGVQQAQLNTVMPNLPAFSAEHLLDQDTMFVA